MHFLLPIEPRQVFLLELLNDVFDVFLTFYTLWQVLDEFIHGFLFLFIFRRRDAHGCLEDGSNGVLIDALESKSLVRVFMLILKLFEIEFPIALEYFLMLIINLGGFAATLCEASLAFDIAQSLDGVPSEVLVLEDVFGAFVAYFVEVIHVQLANKGGKFAMAKVEGQNFLFEPIDVVDDEVGPFFIPTNHVVVERILNLTNSTSKIQCVFIMNMEGLRHFSFLPRILRCSQLVCYCVGDTKECFFYSQYISIFDIIFKSVLYRYLYSMAREFYTHLLQYSPLCYCSKGPPLFMLHSQCFSPCFFLLFVDFICLLAFILAITSDAPKNLKLQDYQAQMHFLFITNVINFIVLNLSYLLTLFLNPGIIDPDQITEQQFQEEKRQFCIACSKPKTQIMKHCVQCKVCVRNLDHHCGFFGKCIADKQTYCFYLLMLSLFATFIIIISTIASTLSL